MSNDSSTKVEENKIRSAENFHSCMNLFSGSCIFVLKESAGMKSGTRIKIGIGPTSASCQGTGPTKRISKSQLLTDLGSFTKEQSS